MCQASAPEHGVLRGHIEYYRAAVFPTGRGVRAVRGVREVRGVRGVRRVRGVRAVRGGRKMVKILGEEGEE